MTKLYYRIEGGEVVGEAGELPAELRGLADETLVDLTPLAGSVPQYSGVGFWPREWHQCAKVAAPERIVDAALKVVIDKAPCVYIEPTVAERIAALEAELAQLRGAA